MIPCLTSVVQMKCAKSQLSVPTRVQQCGDQSLGSSSFAFIVTTLACWLAQSIVGLSLTEPLVGLKYRIVYPKFPLN